MIRQEPSREPRVAQLALAQYLLFEAAVESLAMLGDTVSRLRGHSQGKVLDAPEITEPFRVRYAMFRRMLEEDRLH